MAKDAGGCKAPHRSQSRSRLAFRSRLARAASGDLHLLFLEAGAQQPVHLAGESGHRQSDFALASVPGRRVASGQDSPLGSIPLGRTTLGRTGPAGCLVSAQLAFVSRALAAWLDPPILSPLVFRADSLSGGAVLLLVVQGPETDARRFPALRSGLRFGWLCGSQQLAADVEWRGFGYAG